MNSGAAGGSSRTVASPRRLTTSSRAGLLRVAAQLRLGFHPHTTLTRRPAMAELTACSSGDVAPGDCAGVART